jgi:DNA-binding CsgD family transcriptional regulator
VHPLVKQARLSARERQTLRHLLKGRTESQAARLMRLSASTVHNYTKSLYQKFRVTSRPRLLAKFLADVKV